MASSTSLDLLNLTNALQRVADWHSLGIQLGIKHDKLQRIKRDCLDEDERKSAVLQFWLDSDLEASWQKVISALQRMNLHVVAKEVSAKCLLPFASQDQSQQVSQMQQTPLMTPVTMQQESEEPAQRIPQVQELVPAYPPKTSVSSQQVSEERRKVRKRVHYLEERFQDLVCNTEITFNKKESELPTFLIKLRNKLTLLPAHLRHQNTKLLAGRLSDLGKATTVGEIFSILNFYSIWSFINPSILEHVVSTLGDEPLQLQLDGYLKELHEFEKSTKVCDFIGAWPGISHIPPEFSQLATKMGDNWSQCTLDDVRQYMESLANEASLPSYAIQLMRVGQNSIVITFFFPTSVASHVAYAMSDNFIQSSDTKEVRIDGVSLDEYRLWCTALTVLLSKLENMSTPLAINFPDSFHQTTRQHPNCEALLRACEEGDLDAVTSLLEAKTDVNTRNELGWTALHWASYGGHSEVVKELLSHGAEVDARDKLGQTALQWASDRGHSDVVKELLSHGAEVDARTEDGETPLILALSKGHLPIVRKLLEAGADPNVHGVDGWTALHLASHGGHSDVVKELLSHGAEVDTRDKDGRTALHLASHGGHSDVVKELLSHGAKVDARDKLGLTALHYASDRSHSDVVKELLSHGAEVDARTVYGRTALHLASWWDHSDVVKELLSHGAKVDARDKDGWTALHMASSGGHSEVVKELLSHGAEVDARNVDGDTPLILASRKGHLPIVRKLLEAGADPNVHGEDGLTALMLVAKKGNIPTVSELLKAGAVTIAVNENGLTALMLAVKEGHTAVVEELVQSQSGSSLDIQEKTTGWTALFFASKDGSVEIVRLLLLGDCDPNVRDKNGVTALQVAQTFNREEVCDMIRQHTSLQDQDPLSDTTKEQVLKAENVFQTLFTKLEDRLQEIEKIKEEGPPAQVQKLRSRNRDKPSSESQA